MTKIYILGLPGPSTEFGRQDGERRSLAELLRHTQRIMSEDCVLLFYLIGLEA